MSKSDVTYKTKLTADIVVTISHNLTTVETRNIIIKTSNHELEVTLALHHNDYKLLIVTYFEAIHVI